jgi:cyclopropane-fatty-acyl-phospholipid synthase
MSAAPSWLALQLLDRDLLPDRVIRAGIRRLIAARLRDESAPDAATAAARLRQFAAERSTGPIAIETDAANAQHYEVPPAFYHLALGPHLKYSSAFWDPQTPTLGLAEARMLEISAARAGLADGQRILELGCGWGSLALWMARQFPRAEIVAVSNAATQKIWIDGVAQREGLTNLQIITADMNVFEAPGRFDRIVSVEMFEHMRNWRALLAKVARWLADDGRVFLHIFTHRHYAYPYEVRDRSDWMAAYFFTGGIMPADRLLYEFQDDLVVREHWPLSGTHYQRTAEAWLANMDAHEAAIMAVLRETFGVEARRWWARWRVFFMACAELWGWRQGEEWLVSHYALTKAGPGERSLSSP